jgi:hypothetical protein
MNEEAARPRVGYLKVSEKAWANILRELEQARIDKLVEPLIRSAEGALEESGGVNHAHDI